MVGICAYIVWMSVGMGWGGGGGCLSAISRPSPGQFFEDSPRPHTLSRASTLAAFTH